MRIGVPAAAIVTSVVTIVTWGMTFNKRGTQQTKFPHNLIHIAMLTNCFSLFVEGCNYIGNVNFSIYPFGFAALVLFVTPMMCFISSSLARPLFAFLMLVPICAVCWKVFDVDITVLCCSAVIASYLILVSHFANQSFAS